MPKNRLSPAMKWTVQTSPCGSNGARNLAVRATGASAEIRSPVIRLAIIAMATIQWITIVPVSDRGCRSVRTADLARGSGLGAASAGGCGARVSVSDIQSPRGRDAYPLKFLRPLKN
jgi:hypothetical protein